MREKRGVPVRIAADELGITEKHVYVLIREGHLTAWNISASGAICPQSIRIDRESILRFRTERTINAEDLA